MIIEYGFVWDVIPEDDPDDPYDWENSKAFNVRALAYTEHAGWSTSFATGMLSGVSTASLKLDIKLPGTLPLTVLYSSVQGSQSSLVVRTILNTPGGFLVNLISATALGTVMKSSYSLTAC